MAKKRRAKPALILVMGVAGTGKTTLAREIVRQTQAVYLDNNDIVDAFFPHTREGAEYKKCRPRFYKVLYSITERNLRLGNSVLLDVPHVKEVSIPKWRRFIRRLAISADAELVVIRCMCSTEILKARIIKRGEKRDRWKLKHWNEFLTMQPVDVDIAFPHLDIDTEKSLSGNAAIAVRYIQRRTGRLT